MYFLLIIKFKTCCTAIPDDHVYINFILPDILTPAFAHMQGVDVTRTATLPDGLRLRVKVRVGGLQRQIDGKVRQ